MMILIKKVTAHHTEDHNLITIQVFQCGDNEKLAIYCAALFCVLKLDTDGYSLVQLE